MKNNKQVVLLAVKQSGLALQFASRELRKDKDIVLVALEQDVKAIRYALNMNIASAAIKQNWRALEFASGRDFGVKNT